MKYSDHRRGGRTFVCCRPCASHWGSDKYRRCECSHRDRRPIAYDFIQHWKDKTAVLIELGTECLGVHTGENNGDEGSNLLGFARFQLGSDEGTNL